MNQKSGDKELYNACCRNTVHRLLEKYIDSCREESDAVTDTPSKRRSRQDRFPNLAGFCRYLRIGTDRLDELSEEFPDEINRIYLTLEDEALNSGLPPALLSAYLKKRLGYEREFERSEDQSLRIQFEHDVLRDGE